MENNINQNSSLVKCITCKNEISVNAKVCPKCGENQNFKEKKFFLLGIYFLVSFLVIDFLQVLLINNEILTSEYFVSAVTWNSWFGINSAHATYIWKTPFLGNTYVNTSGLMINVFISLAISYLLNKKI